MRGAEVGMDTPFPDWRDMEKGPFFFDKTQLHDKHSQDFR